MLFNGCPSLSTTQTSQRGVAGVDIVALIPKIMITDATQAATSALTYLVFWEAI